MPIRTRCRHSVFLRSPSPLPPDVLKQQGHFHDLNTLTFSSDGALIATGGDDGKVKLWNTASGFCFVTFHEHAAPVTDVAFVAGKVSVGKGGGGSFSLFSPSL